MKTAYLTTLNVTFNPFLRSGKVPRLFLSMIPPAAYKTMQIKTTQLPRDSTKPARLELGFKDGKMLKYTWEERAKHPKKEVVEGEPEEQKATSLQDIINEVDRHARIQQRKEDLAG